MVYDRVLDMTLLEIVENYPETEDVFRFYDRKLGRCLMCHCLFDRLGDVVKELGVEPDELLKKLNIPPSPGGA